MEPQTSQDKARRRSRTNGAKVAQKPPAQSSEMRLPVTAMASSMALNQTPPVDVGAHPFERDSYASTAFQEILDKAVHATAARFTAGLSPGALAAANADWAWHLATAPGKQFQLLEKAAKKTARLANYADRPSFCFMPPESLPAGRPRNWFRPVALVSRSMRALRSFSLCPNNLPKKSKFSSTLKSA